jgi:hypothetical protein
VLPAVEALSAPLPERVDFNYHIKPLLSDRCFACHGPDEKSRKAKLRLDTREGAFKALTGGGVVLKPGDPAGSELIRRVTSTDPEEVMPPPKANLALDADQIALFRRWVDQGAEWKRHWSFISVAAVPVPVVKQTGWARNEVDRFILARLEGQGLRPSPPASQERLLRRVTLDLTGLPPSLAEEDAFLADSSPGAYERVVERLLASPAYGERMAVDWLDVARYADTYGYQSDRESHLWPWRDWVIRAFNRNLPFNEFIVWQLAGDLLPGATREQRLATAFHRNHRQTNEGGSVEEEFRVEYNADRVHTTAGAFLGLTFECARCHDHKYDPITTRDYYRFFAFFNSTDESGLYSHFTEATPSPSLLLYADDAQERRHHELKDRIAARERELTQVDAARETACTNWLQRPVPLPVPGLVGHYTFEEVVSNRVANAAAQKSSGKLVDGPQPVPGRFGQALGFNGENSVTFEQVADFKRTDPFSISVWLRLAEELPEIVVLHHQQAGSDAGYQGYQLVTEEGCASFALIHFWPGNAIKVRTKARLPLREWVQVGITYDGSSRAAGLTLFVNGHPAEVEVVKDHLFKETANGVPLTLAARFRGRGFKDGAVDELRIYNRCLTRLEMAEVHTPGALAAGLAQGGADARDYYEERVDEEFARRRDELRKLREEENALVTKVPEIMAMGDVPVPRPAYVLKRGAYDAHGDPVEPGTPESILPFDPKLPRNRLGLARWLVDPQHPLTSRVLVNRAWQLFFGRGLVVTAEDFGSQGALPTHPELLDWLAKRFMDSGWDLKALHRLIVLSATYRQVSQAAPELLALDPDNKLLARGPRQRLTAEMLRDQALTAAGLLTARLGGPSVKPFQPEGLWEEKSAAWKYEADRGASLYRRSLYTYFRRTSPHPMMTTFDAAERNTCVVRRQSTSTPLQALVLLNDPQFVEAARQIGARVLREGGPTAEGRSAFAFRLLTGRAPVPDERSVLRRLYLEQLDLFLAHPEQADALAPGGPEAMAGGLPRTEWAAATALVNTLLSFDEVVFKR